MMARLVRYDAPPVYFMHLPRTGGTALGKWLRSLFGGRRYIDLKAFNLPGVTTTALRGFGCLHSWHMGRGIYDWLGRPDLACITLLRQPVERAVSDLLGTQRVALQHPDRFTAAGLAALHPFLHASVDDCVRSHTMDDLVSNVQSGILGSSLTYAGLLNLPAGAPRPPLNRVSWFDFPWIDGDRGCTNAEALGRAHAWLDEMAVVGLTERYAESMLLVADLLGVAIPKESPRVNVNPQRTGPAMCYQERLAPDVVARLEELNRSDLDLYAHATELFEQQWARYRARPQRTYSIAPRLRSALPPAMGALRRAGVRRGPVVEARQLVRWFGERQGLAIFWANRFGADGDIEIKPPQVRHPLYLRLRTSDFRIYGQVMVREEYALPLRNPPRIIVDAGANIGLTAIYLANRFPHARILAVEPDKASFRQLCKNAATYPHITPICAALWSSSQQMPWTGNPDRYGNRRIHVPDDLQHAPAIGQVDTITMSQLMAAHQVDFVDLLKVDIEGAEREVFRTAEPWIDQVGVIIAEMHDRFLPGCTFAFNSTTRDFDLEWRQGEHIVVARRDFIQSESSMTRSS